MRHVIRIVVVKPQLVALRTALRDRRRRRLCTALRLVAVATAAACAGGPDAEPDAPPLTEPTITVTVRNERLERVVIWVQYDAASPRRVGIVDVGTARTFTVAWRRADQVRMIVRGDARGGESVSNGVTVQAGAHLELIRPALGRPTLRLVSRF